MTQHFEDMVIGAEVELGSYTFTAEGIIAFAQAYDPQRFHVDPVAATASPFGGLIASGWHTAAVWMKLMVAYQGALMREALARGETPAKLGPSPGFRKLRWIAPVRPGDTLTYRTRLTAKEDWPKRPQWGLVITDNTAHADTGTLVFQFEGLVLVERRGVTGGGQ